MSGDTVLIGANGSESVTGEFFTSRTPGSAYVFTRSDSTWSQEAELMAEDATNTDLFGASVSLDGNIAAVGAPRDDENGENSGATYILERVSGVWTQQAKLTAEPDGSRLFLGDLYPWTEIGLLLAL